jgi:hypothetical protein
MKQRRRIYYSAAQRSEIWDRWQAGEPMSSIGRRFDRESSSVFSIISPTGGIRPPDRRHSKQTLSLSEREEISRWLSMRRSLRSIARHLGRCAVAAKRAQSPEIICSQMSVNSFGTSDGTAELFMSRLSADRTWLFRSVVPIRHGYNR